MADGAEGRGRGGTLVAAAPPPTASPAISPTTSYYLPLLYLIPCLPGRGGFGGGFSRGGDRGDRGRGGRGRLPSRYL